MRGTASRALALTGAIVVFLAGSPASSFGQDEEQTEPTTPIPPITDADRAAAFPDVESHSVRDNTIYAFVLLDQLEWQGGDSADGGELGSHGVDRGRPGPSVVPNGGSS